MAEMMMADLLTAGRVIPRLRARDKREVLSRLAAHLSSDAGLSKKAVHDAVFAGADVPVFGPSTGVALAHAFLPGLAQPLAVFARLDPAIDFRAADGSLTDLVVLLVSPSERAGAHLRALACIARRLRQQNVREHLRASKHRDSMYAVLVSDDESGGVTPAAPITRSTRKQG